MTISAPMISIRAVSKRFGSFAAVDGINLEIGRSEFFSLLGPSGCGKTTLLRMLGGFEFPTSGEIMIDGEPMADRRPHQRPTNMVFQSYALFPHLTVAENIGYGLLNQILSKSEAQDQVTTALRTIRLDGLGSRHPHQLSGGQRQRVALARALVCRPKVLLLDEPLGALDKKLREEMQLELRQIQREVGITFVFVTHDQKEAMALSDRIAVMANGRLLQIGSPEDIYERPASIAVASFVGESVLFEGIVKSVSTDRCLVELDGIAELTVPLNGKSWAVGEQATVFVRPERIVISTEPVDADTNAVPGRITSVAYLGSTRHLHVEVDGLRRPLLVVEPNAGEASAGRPGDTVWLNWKVTAGQLYKPLIEP